jgi:hypothetical protein
VFGCGRIGSKENAFALLGRHGGGGMFVLEGFLDLAHVPAPGVLERADGEGAGTG